jgi:crotonobetainyl-CoA:carnitine CoA-transferase CaiB-like acyl-CoA transferase
MKHGVALVDVITGKDAAIAILAALVARASTGRGRMVQVSLEGSARAALVNVAQNALVSGMPPRRWGNAHANLVPYQLFEAADRPMVIAVGSDGQWLACARALGLDALAADDALRTNAGRIAAREQVVTEITRALKARTASEWIARLDAAGVPCGLVRTVPEALAESGASALTGLPPSVEGSVRRAPPRLGEHSRVIRERGWDAFAD